MPAGAIKIILPIGIGVVALLLLGVVIGAIGSSILGTDPFLPQPEIHLPPQPVFPTASRECHLGNIPCPDVQTLDNAGSSTDGHGATTGSTDAAGTAQGEGEGEAHATPLGLTEFAVTNTLLSAWFASAVMILFFVLGARKRSLVPGRLQSVVELMFEGILSFSTGVLGSEMSRRVFPIVATIFFFVLFNAWLALLPFYQFLGFLNSEGEMKVHLLRSAGTDVNMGLALALISFVFVEFWGFRVNGLGYLKKFFAVGSLFRRGPFGLIDIFVGILELISEFVRIVSFTFRLFGNMTAGEILIIMITFLVPFVVTNLVFGLELLVGLIQAVIFAGLTLVFLSLAVTHEEH